MRTAAIIPAHNESTTIENVVSLVQRYVGTVIVVDDCSCDDTGSLARGAGAEVVRNEQQRGYDGTLQRGFEHAQSLGHEIVITLDADGQHPADAIPNFLAPLQSGETDIVIGIRSEGRRLAETAFSLYTRFRYHVPDILCGMKGYKMELFRKHGRFDASKSVGTELTLWALRQGYRHILIPVPISSRVDRPRFGNLLRSNLCIARAMLGQIHTDLLR